MTRKPITFRITKSGHLWDVGSDSEAALPTGGVVLTGLSVSDARTLRDTLRKHGKAVECPELDSLVAPSPVASDLGRASSRPDFKESV